MTTSTWSKERAAPTTEDDLSLSRSDDDAATPYTWLDNHAESASNKSAEEDLDFVDIDIDRVPTLYDVYEQTFEFSPDDNDQQGEGVFWVPDDDLPEVQALDAAFAIDADAETPVPVTESVPDHRVDNEAALLADHGDSSEAPPHTLEYVFNLARYQPVQLQRTLLVLACTFQIIAVAALWRAIGNKVVVTELVPPLVYASIGVAAYLLGMRYLRIHFAQVRVSDKDWLQCEQVVVAADNGLILKARFGTAFLIWEQLMGVAQDGDFYYFLIEHNQGFMVPKQGVNDPLLKIKLEDLASLTRAKSLQGI